MPHNIINAAKIICVMRDRPLTDLVRLEHTSVSCQKKGIGDRFYYLLKDDKYLKTVNLFKIPFIRHDDINTRADVKRLYRGLIYATEGNLCATEICPDLAHGDIPKASMGDYYTESGKPMFDKECAECLNDAIYKAQMIWGKAKIDLILFVLATMYCEGYGINHLMEDFKELEFSNIAALLKHYFHITVTQAGFQEKNNEITSEG